MKAWFPEDFSRPPAPCRELFQLTTEQNPLSSSSSSLRSASIDSPDQSSSLIANINSAASSYIPPEALGDFLPPTSIQPAIPNSSSLAQALLQPFGQLGSTVFPSPDSAMTRAMLSVISSPPSSSSSSPKPSAFQKYAPALGAKPRIQKASGSSSSGSGGGSSRPKSMMERAVAYYRSLYLLQRMNQTTQTQGARPSIMQLQHMISERKRREKLNESFQALKSLLPPGSKVRVF